MYVYKIFRGEEYAAFQNEKSSFGAPIDVEDGYIHLSTLEQVPDTLRLHFPQATGLYLLALDADALGEDLKWEASRGGALFPHLYRTMTAEDVQWAEPIPLYNGTHIIPKAAI
ncbi:MAG: DUF952 domain-containing protein [Pseudomonadota bacterium]